MNSKLCTYTYFLDNTDGRKSPSAEHLLEAAPPTEENTYKSEIAALMNQRKKTFTGVAIIFLLIVAIAVVYWFFSTQEERKLF